MVLELLKCTICPKKPSFSDTSHLLTHVSSKGHLSHLHKVQVRSHGEQEAAYQLALYNQWYQEHDLAGLLSDRLQMKQAKQTTRRITGRRQNARTAKKDENTNVQANIFSHPLGDAALNSTSDGISQQMERRAKRQAMLEEMDEPDCIPPFPIFNPDAFIILSSPTRESLGCPCGSLHTPGQPCLQMSPSRKLPESVRLKGQIWPGMDIFDSATEDQAKKRNQRKDGSALVNMHTSSLLIEPLEITYSAGGTLKRTRRMEELENEETLLQGETPMKKQASKRKQKPERIQSRSAVRRTGKVAASTTEEPNIASTPPLTLVVDMDSSFPGQPLNHQTATLFNSLPKEKKVTKRERKPKFPVYQDTVYRPAAPDSSQDSLRSPFLTLPAPPPQPPQYGPLRGKNSSSRHPVSWLQPRSLHPPGYDPTKDFQPYSLNTPDHQSLNFGKENYHPLLWKQETYQHLDGGEQLAPFDSTTGLDSDFGQLSHVYAYIRNPFTDLSPDQSQNTNSGQVLPPIH